MINAHKVYAMLGNESLWETATTCHKVLSDIEIPYSVCGGVAVCLHGYQRNTVDLDLIIRDADASAVQSALNDAGLTWQARNKEFRSASGVAVQFLMAGEPAGKGQEIKIPDPTDSRKVEMIEGLSVLTLAALVDVKLACGSGNMRRTHKDFADVVELIVIHNLDGSFARFLHKSVRKTYRELVHHAQGNE